MKKDIFDTIGVKDIFDDIKLDLMDDVELDTEDKVIYSEEMAALIKEEVSKEISKIPIGKLVTRILKSELSKQKETESSIKRSFQSDLKQTRDEIMASVEALKKEEDEFKTKTRDRYVDLNNKFLALGNDRLYFGGPAAMRIQEENGADLGYPNILKFTNGSITVNDDGSYSIAGGGISQAEADLRYLQLTGGTLTGDLDLQTNFLILQASNASRWKVSVNTDGSLQTDAINGTTGTPMGLLLSLTYPS